jgi:hypothetical protein
MAVRRASSRLARLELQAANLRIEIAVVPFGAPSRTLQTRLDATLAEVRRAKAELRRLLRGDDA